MREAIGVQRKVMTITSSSSGRCCGLAAAAAAMAAARQEQQVWEYGLPGMPVLFVFGTLWSCTGGLPVVW